MPAGNKYFSFALATLVLAACGSSSETPDCDPIAATLVSRIEVTPSSATLADGESVQLTAVAYSCDGSQVATPTITWQSADATTISVNSSGMAVAVKEGGPVMVTAAAQGKQGTARISVAPRAVASVRIEPATANVAVGRTSTLVVRAFDAQGNELSGRSAVWSSGNSGIVTVSAQGAITGIAVGGPVTITATIEGKEGSAQVTVVDAAVATITVSPPSSTIQVGSTVQLQAVLRDDQGNVLTGRAVLWSTSNAGLATVSGTGLVTGVSPGGPVTIVATSEGRSGSAQVTLSPLPLTITTSTLPSGTVGVAYSQPLVATGGVRPYSWTVSAGTLPPGLSLSSAGTLSGTPTADGNYSFTVRATDAASQAATRALSLQVGAALTVTTSSLPSGTIGTAYSSQLTASGGTGPFSWAITSGTLPAGLTLSSAGLVSGTPTAAGSSTFIVQVTDASSRTATKALTLQVSASITITTTTLPGGTVGTSYSQQLSAAGGATPYAWTIASGSLPAGLTLSASGVISGTPTAAGSPSFTVRVTDAASRTATQSLTITVSSSLTIGTTSLPGGIVGVGYSQQLAAAGGTTPYAWVVSSGTLPPGLSLSSTGVLSGTPTTAGSVTFTVRVTDAASRTDTQALTLTVGSSLSIGTTTVPEGTVGTNYSQQLSATGGAPPYAWSVTSGALPDGLTLSGGGVLSGTPTAPGNFSFTVAVSDAGNGSASQPLTLAVVAPLGITTTTLPSVTSGTAYSQSLEATGGSSPYTWSVASGLLPGGLALSSAGVLSGTPTTAGDYSFTARVSDGGSRVATQPLSIGVVAGPAARIVWLQQPTNTETNVAISPAPSVRVQDMAGNAVDLTATVSMSISRPSGADFSDSSTNTAETVEGVASFSNLRISSSEKSVRLRANVGNISSAESAGFKVQ